MSQMKSAASSFSSPRSKSVRAVVEVAALVLAVGLMARSWLAEGLLVPLAVQSGSMAPALLGPHRDVACTRCGLRFAVGIDRPPLPARAFCPNCGDRSDLAAWADVAGDRILMDRSAFLLRRPERWEVVAFRHPQHAADVLVKRVVGLPGESVLVRDGDLYVDGRIQRKTLRQQRALALLVHDAAWAPAGSGVPLRWQARRGESLWKIDQGRLVHPGGPKGSAVDWCEYRHLRPRPSLGDEYQETPIDDQSAYNQALPRRVEEINPVADLLLSMRIVKLAGPGRLVVQITDGHRRFEARLDAQNRRYEALADDRPEPIAAGQLPIAPDRPFQLEVSLFDQQFLVAVDGRPLVAHGYQRQGPPSPPSRPVAIGLDGPEARIDGVRLYRDVYYTRPTGLLGRWGVDKPYRLAADEYFVLGDNSPASDDSRSWPAGPGVPGHLLVGRPLAVRFPSPAMGWAGCQVQLPNPSRIRYIR